MAKRTYTLSDKALQQRRAASPFANKKRTSEPLAGAEYQSINRAERFAHRDHDPIVSDIFAPLPKDAPHSEHQRRAALIRVRQIRNGTLKGSPGGRDRVPRPCPRCNVECDSAREARDHCRVARN